MNPTDEAEIREAFALISGAMNRGVVQGKVMDQVFQKMEGGNAAIASYYAGDYLSMVDNQADDVDLQFVIPEEGGNWFVDAMCVLKDAPHKTEAEMWINFLASTDANLANMDYIGYASPNREALEQYPEYYEALYEEPLDQETYDMVPLNKDLLGDAFRFMKENTVCKVLSYKGNVFGLECPNFMDLVVTETEPGFAGNTATNVTKPATLETGAEIKVPLFIDVGDKITIDTRTGEYLSRCKE